MLTLISACRVLIINNPYLIAGLFIQILLLLTFMQSALVSHFLGLIMFLIYVGGIIILIRYCVMLIPLRKFGVPLPYFLVLFFPLSISLPNPSYAYGILYCASAVFLIGVLLYLVILSVVEIIDYSWGILKIYVKIQETNLNL